METYRKKWLIVLSVVICHLSLSAVFVSCSDWDDHYVADTSVLPSQRATLWENIEGNGNLKQFSDLIRKAGYDSVLNASQTFTVWAPVNNSFDYDHLATLSKSRLQKEFVQNHIARNNYPVSGTVNERVFMLNEKLNLFSGSSMGGIDVDSINLASSNGVIHTLRGKIPFVQNIYESLDTNSTFPIANISRFYHSYDVKKLNENKSVAGPTLNGEITYLDSVFDEHNELFSRYYAYINVEDSNYTMLVPTDDAWDKAKATVSKYFNYVPSFEFMENTSTTASEKKKVTVNIADVEYLQDSIVNLMLTGYLCYNNNLYDNKKLSALKTGETLQCDSLYGTTMSKIYTEDAARLFENAQRVEMSNGSIWVTDSLRMRTWTAWNPEIILESEITSMVASTVNMDGSSPEIKSVTPGTQNPDVYGRVSRNMYVEIPPVSASTNPGVVFYLPNVRSTTYSLYAVVVPANITSTNFEVKPNRFTATIGYVDERGINEEVKMLNPEDPEKNPPFINDSSRVDTVYLGDVTFPVAYAGTGSYYPYLRLNSNVTSRIRAQYDRTLRFDCIILRPKELVDYLREHPDYKYDNGNY